jgi:hypothetical protein
MLPASLEQDLSSDLSALRTLLACLIPTLYYLVDKPLLFEHFNKDNKIQEIGLEKCFGKSYVL